jgi:hypothetical protein
MDCWPPLPICLWYDPGIAPNIDEEDDIIAALRHPDRIHEIDLTISGSMLARSTVWMDESFPELQSLHLRSSRRGLTVLPSSFLGASSGTPRKLRHIRLGNISFPTFPQLLLSSRDLVSLSLNSGFLLDEEFPSPEILIAALSASTHLQQLSLHADFETFPSEPESPHPPPPPLDLITFPTLVKFDFKGSTEYLEDFVSRIDAPHLKQLFVSFFRQESIDIPQLSLFISRTQELSSLPHLSSITLWDHEFTTIEHRFRPPQLPHESIRLVVRCSLKSWEVSQVVHLCSQLSSFMTIVEQLQVSAYYFPPSVEPETDSAPLLELLAPFRSVQELQLWSKEWLNSEPANVLERSTRETVQRVLPALRVLRLHGYCTNFAARHLDPYHRPVTVRRTVYFNN